VAFVILEESMNDPFVRFTKIAFSYDRAAQPLFRDLTAHFALGWTGVVGANGVGKSTILKLATGILESDQGHVNIPGLALYCEQRTDVLPDRFEDLLASEDSLACKARGQLGIQPDWQGRWATLSHGERKRAQIATALWQEPPVIALDEPTNHLDADARRMLVQALESYRGVGILVSHDRDLLDTLCHQCLFVEPPTPVMRPGNYSQGMKQAHLENLAARRMRENAQQEMERLKQEATRRKETVQQAARKLSKRGLARGDRDGRAKIDTARLNGKDAAAGRRLRQLTSRLAQSREQLERITVKKDFDLGIWLEGARSQRNTLFGIPAGSFSLGNGRHLEYPDLVMQPTDRIALTGPNGCGKSTLLSSIMRSLNLEPDRVTYIPQEIDICASRQILEDMRALTREKLGQVLIVVSRLGTRPQRLLETDEPSPGEIRKILLASGIANVPHLIVMDEPTNHLDLPSIECLEEALANCPCGLLLVSHDRRFLDALTHQQWHISEEMPAAGRFILRTS
jgi:macrolide transport system ATP-binding/permease protein